MIRPVLAVGVAAILLLGSWGYALLVYGPTFQATLVARGQPQGSAASDLYSAWLPARELLLHGRDPYSPAMAAEIQTGYYGRPVRPDDPASYEMAFVYPLYIIFGAAPTVGLPFATVQTLFMVLGPVLVVMLTQGWLVALGWWPSAATRLALVLLGLGTLPAINTLLLQQPSLFVVVLLAAACACLGMGVRRTEAGRQAVTAGQATPTTPTSPALPGAIAPGWCVLAGALLAGATIKPQLMAVLLLWLAVWVLGDWRRRWGLLGGFGTTLLGLTAAAWVVRPGWPAAWLGGLDSYLADASEGGVLDLWLFWLPPPLRLAVMLLAGAAGLGWAWRTRRAMPGSLPWSLGLAFTGIYSILLFPRVAAYNQLLLYPALGLLLQYHGRLWRGGSVGRLVQGLALVAAGWSALSATTILLAWIGAGGLGGTTAAAQVARAWPWPWVGVFVVPVLLLPPLLLLTSGRVRTPEGA